MALDKEAERVANLRGIQYIELDSRRRGEPPISDPLKLAIKLRNLQCELDTNQLRYMIGRHGLSREKRRRTIVLYHSLKG